MKCLLVGNYGEQNLGDEALKNYMLHAFQDIEWSVLSSHPQKGEFPRLPGGIRSFLRFDWLQTLQAYRRTDAVVFGGGSLWTDVESVYACMLWTLHAALAYWYKKPVFLAFQGIGPFHKSISVTLTRWVVGRATFVSVRDHASYMRLQEWGVLDVCETFDPLFVFMQRLAPPREDRGVFVIIPRHTSTQKLVDEAAAYIRLHAVGAIHILSMQPDHPSEQEYIETLQKELPAPSVIIPIHTIQDLLQELAGSMHVLTQRFHGALAALAIGAPQTIMPQSEGDKLSELLQWIHGHSAHAGELSTRVEKGEETLRRSLSCIA